MKQWLIIPLIAGTTVFCTHTIHRYEMKEIEKNGMRVKWSYRNDRVYFEMTAPTNGWVTIGFNEADNMTGAYLLMGRIHDEKAELVEHYTISPGNYQPISDLHGEINIDDVLGSETESSSTISFSVAIRQTSNYYKNLSEGQSYWMILAYSQEDDFQHHSIMRTSTWVEL